MKRILILTALLLTLGGGIAYANDTTPQPDINGDDYNFSLSGQGACQTDGSFLITWTITNISTPPYPNSNPVMTLSDKSPAPVSGTVDALGTKTFTQSVDGTTPGVTTQSDTGSWNTDADDIKTEAATVSLDAPCLQPVKTVAPSVTVESTPSPFSPPVPGFGGK